MKSQIISKQISRCSMNVYEWIAVRWTHGRVNKGRRQGWGRKGLTIHDENNRTSFKDNEFKEKQEEDHTDSNVSDSVVNISHWKMVTVTKFCLLVLEFFHFRVDWWLDGLKIKTLIKYERWTHIWICRVGKNKCYTYIHTYIHYHFFAQILRIRYISFFWSNLTPQIITFHNNMPLFVKYSNRNFL